MAAQPNEVTILLVEDDPGHARLIEKNLRRTRISNTIVHVRDGQTALDYLLSENEYAGTTLPESLLVLLDLNLPGMSGFQVLQRMKSDVRTRSIPVVILTTTDDQREVERCYELGCSVYITKPVDYERFTEAIWKLGLLFSIVAVPHQDQDQGHPPDAPPPPEEP
ncbi:MAG: response regulator [Candidatus Hydrogenedentota bacterium]